MEGKKKDWRSVVERIVTLEDNIKRLRVLNASDAIIDKVEERLEEEQVNLVFLISSQRVELFKVEQEKRARRIAHKAIRQARLILEKGRLGELSKEMDYKVAQL